MKRRLAWFIARRYLATRRPGRFLSLISLIAISGITLGVMALITVIAVMTGLQTKMLDLIIGSTPHMYVFDAYHWGSFRLEGWEGAIEEIRSDPAVVSAEPFVMTMAVAVAGETNASSVVPGRLYGIDPHLSPTPLLEIEQQIRAGEYAFGPTSGLPGILVGSGAATQLGVLEGDTIIIWAPETMQATATGEPYIRSREFEVTGVFRTGMYEYDEQFMYVSLDAARDLMGFPVNTVSGIGVDIADEWAVEQVKARLSEATGGNYTIESWRALNGPLFEALKLEKVAMFVILFLIVVVAAFNIISTLVMVVADKTREIGILKSMGMTDRVVMRIFMVQGLAIGAVGTLLGTLGGIGLVWLLDRYKFIKLPGNVYFIDYLPVELDPLDVMTIIAASILIAFVATIHPSRQASRLEVVDAIRHE